MRIALLVNAGFFLFFIVLAGVRGLPAERRWKVTAIGTEGLLLTAAAILADLMLLPQTAPILRDWLPAPMMLLAYWQAGQFFTAPNPKLQAFLENLDQRWLGRFLAAPAKGGAIGTYLEFAYLFCYPLVPLALGCLYWNGLRERTGEFWEVVVPASYACYAMVPFFQTLPPRAQEESRRFGATPGDLRRLNLTVLHRASIQANTFPSAHVAASLAASLVVARFLPVAGAVFLWISLSIAAAAVLRRYHYALDILAGALVAGTCFLLGVLL